MHCMQQVSVEWNHLFSPFLLAPCIQGPVHWNELFPIADGNQQSPIEIKTKEVKYDSSLRPLCIKYDASSAKIISNSGHSFNVDFDDMEDKSGWLFGGRNEELGCLDGTFFSHIWNTNAVYGLVSTLLELVIKVLFEVHRTVSFTLSINNGLTK